MTIDMLQPACRSSIKNVTPSPRKESQLLRVQLKPLVNHSVLLLMMKLRFRRQKTLRAQEKNMKRKTR